MVTFARHNPQDRIKYLENLLTMKPTSFASIPGSDEFTAFTAIEVLDPKKRLFDCSRASFGSHRFALSQRGLSLYEKITPRNVTGEDRAEKICRVIQHLAREKLNHL